MKKHPKKHIYTKHQNQNQPEEMCLFFKIQYLSEQKKVDKYFLTNNWQMKIEGREVVDLFQGIAVFT